MTKKVSINGSELFKVISSDDLTEEQECTIVYVKKDEYDIYSESGEGALIYRLYTHDIVELMSTGSISKRTLRITPVKVDRKIKTVTTLESKLKNLEREYSKILEMKRDRGIRLKNRGEEIYREYGYLSNTALKLRTQIEVLKYALDDTEFLPDATKDENPTTSFVIDGEEIKSMNDLY